MESLTIAVFKHIFLVSVINGFHSNSNINWWCYHCNFFFNFLKLLGSVCIIYKWKFMTLMSVKIWKKIFFENIFTIFCFSGDIFQNLTLIHLQSIYCIPFPYYCTPPPKTLINLIFSQSFIPMHRHLNFKSILCISI